MENSNRQQNKQTKNTAFLKYYKDQMKKCKATSTPKQAKYSGIREMGLKENIWQVT